jgi:hypothetical protein
VVRAHRQAGAPGWTIEHPLIQVQLSADHPGDAFVLAGAELRRVLANEDLSGGSDRAGEGEAPNRDSMDDNGIDDVAETVCDTLTRRDPGPETVAALRGALAALDVARDEVHRLRHQDALRTLARREAGAGAAGAEARAELRRQHRERLAAVGVDGADVAWRSDAFGPADEYGVTLPALVAGFAVRTDWPERAFWVHEPPAGRRWLALDHHWHNDDVWSYDPKSLVVVATVLTVDDAVELGLRRLTDDLEEGDTIAAHGAYAAATTRHLPGVVVGAVRGWVGRHALPFPMAAIATLTGAPVDDLSGVGVGLWWLNAEPT